MPDRRRARRTLQLLVVWAFAISIGLAYVTYQAFETSQDARSAVERLEGEGAESRVVADAILITRSCQRDNEHTRALRQLRSGHRVSFDADALKIVNCREFATQLIGRDPGDVPNFIGE